MAIVTHIYIGWGLLHLSKLATFLTHNVYWGLPVALLIIAPFYWIISQLAKRHPGLSISQIFSRVFGGPLGAILAILFFLHIAYFQLIFFHDSQLMVYTYFFKRTPFFLITALLIAGASYPALRGAESVGRLAQFLLFPPFLVILGLQLLGLANINPLNLQPVFGGSFRDWLLTGTDLVTVLLPGAGLAICLFFLKKPESVGKITLYSLAMVIPLFFTNILGIIGTFGPMVMRTLNWPTVEFLQLIDFPFLLLEQTGLFFLAAWYASIFVTLSVGAFFVGNEFHLLFPRIKRQWFTVIYCLLLWTLVNLPVSMVASETFFQATHRLVTFSFLSFFGLTWLVGWFRFKTGRKPG
jgi:spore germination protein (amino acid permease)